MIILDGKTLSQKLLLELKSKLDDNSSKPNLDIILVGDDPASRQYDEMKLKRANEIGIGGKINHLPQDSTTENVLDLVSQLNKDPNITAFMVQLPLPKQIDTSLVLNAIDPRKDADGLTSTNLGLLFQNDPKAIASATAIGVIKLIEGYNIDLVGKNAVIIGRSHFIGLPLSALFLSKDATVTICHSHTKNLKEICQKADILVSAVGKKNFITKDFVRQDSVVIDIGLSADPETGKLVGDVDFAEVSQVASHITPVPGGIGPMTIASLLSNTVNIFEKQK
jgi:methylenetetrahydrofolate dehydrogenase (NADP+)/methenyltetrahydrofolate cyclohydrolase